MAHISIGHVARMNASWHTYQKVIHLCEWVLAHISFSHVKHHTYDRVMTNISMSNVTRLNASWRTYQ